jgi:hypothetical protein
MISSISIRMALVAIAFTLAGCQDVESYKNSRKEMTDQAAYIYGVMIVETGGNENPEAIKAAMKKDSYRFGQSIHGLKQYYTSTKMAAELTGKVLGEASKAQKSKAPVDPAVLKQIRATFNRADYQSLVQEVLFVKDMMYVMQDVCKNDPYSRNCTAFARILRPTVDAIRTHYTNYQQLMKL